MCKNMEYISGRVTIYCKEGRIDGAILMGKMWLIPKGTIKPEDPRKRKLGMRMIMDEDKKVNKDLI